MYLNGAFQATPSSPVIIGADTVPLYMNKPSLVSVTPYTCTIAWSSLGYPFDGGAPVTFYQVEWYDYYTN